MSMCRELGYTLSDFTTSESIHNLRLWYGLRLLEQKEQRERELERDVLEGLEANKGRFTRGI